MAKDYSSGTAIGVGVSWFVCVHFAFLLLSCTIIQTPADQRLTGYLQLLNQLPRDEVNSIGNARCALLEWMPQAPIETRDGGFVAFRSFYYEVIDRADERLLEEQERLYKGQEEQGKKTGRYDELRNCVEKSALQNGLVVTEPEGYLIFEESDTYFLTEFGKYVSHPIKAFLEIRQRELAQVFQEDGALRVPFHEVTHRCVMWEDYLSRYPQSPLRADAQRLYDAYVSTLFTGTVNTRVMESEAKYVDPSLTKDIEDGYRYAVEQWPNSRVASLVKDYWPILKAKEFVDNPEAHDLLEKNGIAWMAASRWLLR